MIIGKAGTLITEFGKIVMTRCLRMSSRNALVSYRGIKLALEQNHYHSLPWCRI
jgi:hypothetical protein